MEDPAPGAPCWVSLTTHDTARAEQFYGAVLGWSFRDGTLGAGFRVALSEGEAVAGLNEASVAPGLAERWTIYFATPSADRAAERIVERGGTAAVGPLKIGPGRVVVAADPGGASFGLWEGKRPVDWSVGAGHAPAWLELHTHDASTAAPFYGEVFDWSDSPDHSVRYQEAHDEVHLLVHGKPVAGIAGSGAETAPDPRPGPRWAVTFPLADLEAAVAAAERAGGRIVTAPHPTSKGTAVTLRDPDDTLFSLLQPAP